MNLNEDDIINAIESYRTKWDKSQAEMAKLCGMANSSVYNKWVNKMTKWSRIHYLLKFLENTDQSLEELVSFKKYVSKSKNIIEEPAVKLYSCPDCIQKQKEIDLLNKEIKEVQKKHIECLEKLTGSKKGNHIANSA